MLELPSFFLVSISSAVSKYLQCNSTILPVRIEAAKWQMVFKCLNDILCFVFFLHIRLKDFNRQQNRIYYGLVIDHGCASVAKSSWNEILRRIAILI